MAQHKKASIKPKVSLPKKLRPQYILLVEDDPAHAAAIRSALRTSNAKVKVKVRITGSLQEYRNAVATSLPDIVLINMNLPDGNALDVMTSPSETGSFPIVVMANKSNKKIAARAIKAGALDFVVKSPEAFTAMPRTIERAMHGWKLMQESKRTEELLRESEKKYKAIIEGAAEGILIADLKTRKFKYANPIICSMLGYSTDELVGLSVNDIHPPEHLPEVIAVFESQARGEITLSHPIPCLRKDGSVFFSEINTAKVIIDGIPCNVGFFTDITERKQAEQQITDALNYIKTIFEASPIGIITYKESGETISVNRAAAMIVGATSEQVQTQNFKELKSWERSGLREAANAALASGDERDIEVHDISTFGKEAWFAAHFVPFKHQGRKELLVLLSDITERKRAEEVLRESEEKFKYVFNHSVVGKSIKFLSGEINVNKAFCEMVGYTKEELQRKRWQEITHPDDIELTQRAMDSLASGEQDSARFNKRFMRKDGAIVWADINSSLRYDKEGKPLYFITTLIDITERKHVEEELKESERRFRTLVENSTDVFSLVDQKGQISYRSPSASRVLDIPDEEIINTNMLERIWPGDLKDVKHTFDQMLQAPRKSIAFQARVKDKDGLPRWIEGVGTNLITDPIIHAIVINYRDIAERKRAEEALREIEARYRLISENTADVIWTLSFKTGKFTYVSDSVQKMRGYTPEEVMNQTMADALTQESFQTVTNLLQQEITKRGPGDISRYRSMSLVDQLCKDGSVVPTEVV